MSDDTTPDPVITVGKSPVPDQVWRAAQALIIFGGGMLVEHVATDARIIGLGIAAVTAAAGALPAAAAYAYGAYRGLVHHHQRVALANAAPDTVAVVKP